MRGIYRAGSAGLMVNGEVLGECHRVAHARALGIDKPVPLDRKIMFQGGETNEDSWERLLTAAGQRVLRGQRVSRTFDFGTVAGSPDLVLCDSADQPIAILELKQVSATNSAIYRELEGSPDSKHLIQSATYSWLTGLPVVLCYTSRSDFALQFAAKKYGVKKIEPFYRIFYLEWRNGVMFYRDEQKSTWVKTSITPTGIEHYYRLLRHMETEKTLLGRPSDLTVTGEPMAYNRCDYCPLQSACDSYEHSYPTWIDAVHGLCRTA